MKDYKMVRISPEMHRRAKIRAAELGLSLIDYLTKLIKEDENRNREKLKKRRQKKASQERPK